MERLTERSTYGVCGNNERVKHYPLYAIANSDPLDHGIIGACFNKLADYEDAEEKGLLLQLPIALGAPCYVIETCKCYEGCWKKCQPDNIRLTSKVKAAKHYKTFADMHYCCKVYERPFNIRHLGYYGKRVFATFEEAEAALQKMGE